mmetsp:Transcript_77976/g.130951  ORF Transcript_77976/g.130951 Transcript_77976/m.130951 type:complete len:260 (-) Transcript_77976:211-990(-)
MEQCFTPTVIDTPHGQSRPMGCSSPRRETLVLRDQSILLILAFFLRRGHHRTQSDSDKKAHPHHSEHLQKAGLVAKADAQHPEHGEDQIVIKTDHLREQLAKCHRPSGNCSDVSWQPHVPPKEPADEEAPDTSLAFAGGAAYRDAAGSSSDGGSSISNREVQNAENSNLRWGCQHGSEGARQEICHASSPVKLLFTDKALESGQIPVTHEGDHQSTGFEHPCGKADGKKEGASIHRRCWSAQTAMCRSHPTPFLPEMIC